MQLPALLISDLHLTSNPSDEYRWNLFKWLADEIVHEDVKTLVILGDLTDAKDFHSSTLVNRIVNTLTTLTYLGVTIKVLQGNHDYLKAGHSFFGFLSTVPGITFITTMQDDGLDGGGDGPLCFYLPHTKTPAKDWAGLDFSHYSYVFMHQTVSGSVASNGQEMDGEEMPDFSRVAPKVYSGDIHVPQVIKGVEYVGSPYHVHFGDDFKPRAVLIDRRNRPVDLHFESPRRVAIKVSSYEQLRGRVLNKGDHVKLTMRLTQAEATGWLQVRRQCEAWLASRGAVVHDIRLELTRSERRLQAGAGGSTTRARLSDPDAVLRFVEREELGGAVLQAGLEAMK